MVKEDKISENNEKIDISNTENGKNDRPLAAKIILVAIGLMIVCAGTIVAYAGIYTIFHKYNYDMGDIGLLILLASFIYGGVMLIVGAFVNSCYASIHFFGAVMTGFAMWMLCCGIMDFEIEAAGGIRNLIGDVFFFQFLFAAGILLIIISFSKKRKDGTSINSAGMQYEHQRMLYEKMNENNALALAIRFDDVEPYYAGSRVGGIPYSDGTKDTPVTKDSRKMTFLMQINLGESEAPDSPFPKSGLLQFFVYEGADYNIDIKALYYPVIDSMRYDAVGDSMGIRIVPGAVEGDYLLGPVRYMPPISESEPEDRRIDKPLLYISPESPIMEFFGERYRSSDLISFQTFISKAGLDFADFSDLTTVTEMTGEPSPCHQD